MKTLHPVLIAVDPVAAARTPECVQRQRDGARRALEVCTARCGAPKSGWQQDDSGAPLPNNGFYWSVSHKPRWAGAVIARHRVGIDIEHIVPRRPELLDELADDPEWDIIGDRTWKSFFRLWTAKEAALKAIGLGIGRFSDCRLKELIDEVHMTLVLEGAVWRVEHHFLGDHVAAVARHDDARNNAEDNAILWHLEGSPVADR